MVGKYIADAWSRAVLEAVALCADEIPARLPCRYDGAAWVTDAGERHDFALLRRNMGDWLSEAATLAETHHSKSGRSLLHVIAEERRMQSDAAWLAVQDSRADDFDRLHTVSVHLRDEARDYAAIAYKQASALPNYAATSVRCLRHVADDMHNAPTGRARHLLDLASQFDGFRAPHREPADWVATLGTVPRSVHHRTAEVWDAFCAAEPALSAKLGPTGGKRALYAAMDKRYGVRTRLGGYSGWRGVGMPGA